MFIISNLKIELHAGSLNRRDEIKSKGNLKFENGEVFVTSSDLLYLADEIDALESSYKCNLVDALNVIGTYFKNDGSITYDSNQNEVNNTELKTNLSFGSIKQGILNSQSLQSVKTLQATDSEGNLLYYANEEAKNKGENLNITTTDTGFPVFYKEAGANNISAGCAAWVNGVLIKGNGEDNKVSWQNGYNEGYAKGMADSLDKAEVIYSYHQHTGDDSQIGGCYGTLTGTKPVLCGCTQYAHTDSLGHSTCANCWHNHGVNKCGATTSYTTYEYIGLTCGKTEQTIESATIVYE